MSRKHHAPALVVNGTEHRTTPVAGLMSTGTRAASMQASHRAKAATTTWSQKCVQHVHSLYDQPSSKALGCLCNELSAASSSCSSRTTAAAASWGTQCKQHVRRGMHRLYRSGRDPSECGKNSAYEPHAKVEGRTTVASKLKARSRAGQYKESRNCITRLRFNSSGLYFYERRAVGRGMQRTLTRFHKPRYISRGCSHGCSQACSQVTAWCRK